MPTGRPRGCGKRVAAWLAPVLLLLSSGSAGAVHLEVERVTVAGGAIEFYPRPCRSRGETGQLQPVGKAGDWEVMVDRSSEAPGFQGETFHYFLHLVSNGEPEHCFQLTATPAGTFRDQRSSVRLRVVDGEERVEGEIQLVLHNGLEAPQYLDAEPVERPAEGGLFGELATWLRFTNRLEDVTLTIDPIEVDADRPSRWRVLPGAVAPSGSPHSLILPPDSTKHRAVRIEGRASAWRAFGAALNPLTAGVSHEVVTARIEYRTAGGVPRQLDVAVPIRFEPSIFAVAMALGFGLLVGCLVPAGKHARVLGWRLFWRRWALAVPRVAPVALIAWALGLILVNGGSQFRLFGVTLDPDQLMPAFLIGALCGVFDLDIAVAKRGSLEILGRAFGPGAVPGTAGSPTPQPPEPKAQPQPQQPSEPADADEEEPS